MNLRKYVIDPDEFQEIDLLVHQHPCNSRLKHAPGQFELALLEEGQIHKSKDNQTEQKDSMARSRWKELINRDEDHLERYNWKATFLPNTGCYQSLIPSYLTQPMAITDHGFEGQAC